MFNYRPHPSIDTKRSTSANIVQRPPHARLASLVILLFLLIPSSALADQSDLDPLFNGTGIQAGPASFGIRTGALQPDGKVLVAGFSASPSGFAVMRYNEDGGFDTTFNATGTVVTSDGALNQIRGMVLQPDGKIVVVGEAFVNGGQDFAVVRYNADGSLDNGFANGGKLIFAVSATSTDGANGVTLQADGDLLICGYVLDNFGTNFAILRVNTNGTLDSAFGVGGLVTTNIRTTDSCSAIAVQADEKIVAVGSTYNDSGGNSEVVVVRYNANGALDTSFDGDGIALTSLVGESPKTAFAVAIQSDQKILVAGNANWFLNNAYQGRFALFRFDTSGTLDTTFDGDGFAYTSFLDEDSQVSTAIGKSLVVKPNGKIVMSGFIVRGSQTDRRFAVAQYNPNGSLDTAFDGNGQRTYSFNTPNEMYGISLAYDGKLLVFGSSPLISVLFRLKGERINGISVRFDFDGDGKADVSVYRPSSGVWYLNRSHSGFTGYQFGISTDIAAPADLTGDGKTDVAVFRPSNGTWYVLRSEDLTFYGGQFGTHGDLPVPADYDGDGKADIAVFRPSDGTWYLQQSTAGFTGVRFGTAGDKPTIGDYDGDGKSDIALYRPSNQVWYRLNSADGSFSGAAFGAPDDIPLVMDYDGDGIANLAVFRPSTSMWFIARQTGLPSQNFDAVQFGVAGDTPVPADYDGDGKTDVGVFRPSDGNWYMLQSTSGFTGVHFGISEDKPTPSAYLY